VSDWLQGPYLYSLYESYGFRIEDIALLFIIGFVSSAVFGTVVANTADVWYDLFFSFRISIGPVEEEENRNPFCIFYQPQEMATGFESQVKQQ
jgi:hypothetical protein